MHKKYADRERFKIESRVIMNIYFDNAATTKVDDKVLDEMLPYFNILYGNPSSNNSCGRTIKDNIEESRLVLAETLNCAPNEIIFTSGATEGNNLIIKSCEELCSKTEEIYHFIFSEIEHKSILNLKEYLESRGHEVDLISVLPNGIVDLNDLENLLQENTVLVSCIYANNETGMIQPISEISKLCQENNILFHSDATQAFGKLKIDLSDLKLDFLSLSAHKFHGPKGIGAIYKSNSVDLSCQMLGGSQENGYRSGTENVPGIIGLGEATKIARKNINENYSYFTKLEKYFLKKLDSCNFNYILNGDLCCKVPWIFNIAFLDTDSDTIIEKLNNFCLSKSSACSKGNQPSYVLQAMNIDEDLIKKSIRISFSKYTTFEQIDIFCKELSNTIRKE